MTDLHLLGTLSWQGVQLTHAEFTYLIQLRESGVSWPCLTKKCSANLQKKLSKAPNWWEQGQRDIEIALKNSLSLITIADLAYPTGFLKLTYPPFLLTTQGQCPWMKLPSLAIVGSREASEKSLLFFEELFSEVLTWRKLNIVSGGARGVDQRAHALALRRNIPTTFLLPSGLLAPYPAKLRQWLPAVLESGGGFLSPFSPKTSMYKGHFQWRNQMIAALSPLVFVVQAALNSGTMITARWAMHFESEIAVFPAEPWNTKGGGSNRLIQQGAQIILDSWDLQVLIDRCLMRHDEVSRC